MDNRIDDYKQMIGYAVQAPSGHNTQAWLFVIKDNGIDVLPDYSRQLPVVDASHRELFISLGCAVANLCISATSLGYESRLEMHDDNTMTVWLQKFSSVVCSPLFEFIDHRQTNRRVYNGELVSDEDLGYCLSDLESVEGVDAYLWANRSSVFDMLKQFMVKGNCIQMDNELFRYELKSWMRFNEKESEQKKDGLSYVVFGAPNLPAFISKPIMNLFLNSKMQNKGDIAKIDSASHVVLFTTSTSEVKDWINLGQYLQCFLLRTTQKGIATSYLNQACEIQLLSDEMSRTLPINGQVPQMLLRVGYAKPAPYSKRRDIASVIE